MADARSSHEPLTPGSRWLLLTYAGSFTASAIAATFVNLFIFVVSGNLAALALFNGAFFFSLSFVFYLVAWVFRRHSPLIPYQWGLVLTAAFYGLLLVLLKHASHYILWLGLLEGVAQGCFWFGANLMTFDTVNPAQRIRYYSLSSAIGSVTGMAGPLAGGALVGLLPGLRGYVLVFALALAVYAVTFAISFSVPKGPPLGVEPLMMSLRLPRLVPLWKNAFQTLMVRGTREAMSGLAGVFLVYIVTKNALAVGVYASVTALFRMMGAFGVSRRVTPAKRAQSLWIGTIGMTVGGLFLLLMQVSFVWVFVYGLIMAFSMPWFTVPNEAIPLDVMDHDPMVGSRRVAYMLSREIGLNTGRLFSMVVLMVLYAWRSSPWMLVVMVIATSLAQGWVANMGKRIWSQLASA